MATQEIERQRIAERERLKKLRDTAQPEIATKKLETSADRGAFDLGTEAKAGDPTVSDPKVSSPTMLSPTQTGGAFDPLTESSHGVPLTESEQDTVFNEGLFGESESTLIEQTVKKTLTAAEAKRVKELQEKQEEELRFFETQKKIASDLETRGKDEAVKEGQSAISSVTAQFAGGRETPLSASNQLLAGEFATVVNDRLNRAQLQIDQSRLRRDQLQIRLQEAQKAGKKELASDIQRSIQLAQTALNDSETEKLDAQTKAMESAAQIRNNAFDSFEELPAGALADMEVADIANGFGIDVATATVMKSLDAQRAKDPERIAEIAKKIKEARVAGMTSAQKNFITLQGITNPKQKEDFLRVINANPNLQVIKFDDKLLSIDEHGQSTVIASASDANGWGIPPTKGFRTDRHNNPTAVIYEGFSNTFKKLGYEEGVDFTKGDVFVDNPNLHSIRFKDKETGIQAAVDLIDSEGFFTQAGGQRWTHTAMSNKEWNVLSEPQKRNVIKEMYRKEGGSGEIFGDAPATDTAQTIDLLQSRIDKINTGIASSRRDDNLKTIQDAFKRGGFEEADAQLRELEITKWGGRIGDAVTLFNKDIANFKDIRDKSSQMDKALEAFDEGVSPLAVDQALISLFNKITDPGSVVRESEFNRTADSLGFKDKIFAKPQKWLEGGVGITDENRQDIVKLAKALVEGAGQSFTNAKNTAINKSKGLNVPQEFLFSQLGLNESGEFGKLTVKIEESDDANDVAIYDSSLNATDSDIELYNNLDTNK